MIRTVLSFVLLAAIAVVAAWFADRPGDVVIDWPGYRIELSISAAVIAVLALMVVSAAVYSAWRWLRRGPARIGGARVADRQRRGYRALALGMTAVAAGDAEQARRQSRRAEALLDDAPLTLLLSAQAAQLNSDETAAKSYFTAMLARPETELLGVRGLLAHARRAGDTDTALAYARRAARAGPQVPWVSLILFDLESRAGHWAEAEAVLDGAVGTGALTAQEARRRKAIARWGQARAAEAAGRGNEALEHAAEAHKLEPGFVPAAVLAARLAHAAGKMRKAGAIILAAWPQSPHPDLAAAYRDLKPDEPAAERSKRIEKLAAANPGAAESRIALAQAALEAEDGTGARHHLEQLVKAGADRRVYGLMADLEYSEEGGAAAARLWRERAEHTAEPGWQCSACGAPSPDWLAYCVSCEAFDTLVWQSTLAGEPALARPVEETLPVPAEPDDASFGGEVLSR